MPDIRFSFGTDREILGITLDWLKEGHRVVLVTVVNTWGSSPRPAGSLMVMRDDGRFEGSVSGGCIEDDLLLRFKKNELPGTLPSVIDYGVKAGDAASFGLPCGGRLELLIEELDHEAQLEALLRRLDAGELVRRSICLNTGEVSLHTATPNENFNASNDRVEQVFGPAWRLLLVGAGQLARYTSRIALQLGYQVTVCEPREEHRAGWYEEGVELVSSMPDEAVLSLANHPRAAVITLAHDPRVDDMALMEALKANAFYVGALGSKKTNADRRERLARMEISESQINNLHGPVGLDIGSRTPAEIALSIMAGITAKRRNAPMT